MVVADGEGAVCEFGRAEGQAPDPVEVVLGTAQVEGERFVKQAHTRQRFLQPVDRAAGGFEDLVEVVGGGVIRRVFGDRVPLLAFAAPVKEIGAGEDELVAVVAVQLPGTGVAVDDRLEGAESAFGRRAAAR